MVTVAVIIGLVAFIATISAQQSSADEKEKLEDMRLERIIFLMNKLEHHHHHHHHKYEHAVRFFDKETANLRKQFFAIVHKEKQTEEEFAAALDTLFAGLSTNIETAYKTFKTEAAKRKNEYDTKVASLTLDAKRWYDEIKAVQNKSLSHAETEKEEIKLFNSATPDQQKELEGVFPRLAEKAKRKAELEAKLAALSPDEKTVYEAIKEAKKLFIAATNDQQKELEAFYWSLAKHRIEKELKANGEQAATSAATTAATFAATTAATTAATSAAPVTVG